jgi:hypothetical protein
MMPNAKMSPAVRRALTHVHFVGHAPQKIHGKTRVSVADRLCFDHPEEVTVAQDDLEKVLSAPFGKVCARFYRLGLRPASHQSGRSGTISFVGYGSAGYVVKLSVFDPGSFYIRVSRFDSPDLSFSGDRYSTALPQEIEDHIALIETEDDQIRVAQTQCALAYMEARKAASERPDSRDILGAYPSVKQIAQGLRITNSETWQLLYAMDQKGLVHLSCASDDLYDNECTLLDKAA